MQNFTRRLTHVFNVKTYDTMYMTGAFAAIMAAKTIDDKMHNTASSGDGFNPVVSNVITSYLWVAFFGTYGVPFYAVKRLAESYPYRRPIND